MIPERERERENHRGAGGGEQVTEEEGEEQETGETKCGSPSSGEALSVKMTFWGQCRRDTSLNSRLF